MKSKLPVLAAVLAFAALSATTASAQGVKMVLRPESNLKLDGSSNVHDWSCQSSAFTATVEVDTAFATRPLTQVARPITAVDVVIPVQTLKCGHKKMDSNMYEALNAEKYPDIRFTMESYTIDKAAATADTFVAHMVGQLSVAGKTIKVEIPLKTERKTGGSAIGEGNVALKMTDFGIKPPVALLGTLRTKDKIDISFKVLLDKSTVVALGQE